MVVVSIAVRLRRMPLALIFSLARTISRAHASVNRARSGNGKGVRYKPGHPFRFELPLSAYLAGALLRRATGVRALTSAAFYRLPWVPCTSWSKVAPDVPGSFPLPCALGSSAYQIREASMPFSFTR